jgi:transcription elongation factor Elf1
MSVITGEDWLDISENGGRCMRCRRKNVIIFSKREGMVKYVIQCRKCDTNAEINMTMGETQT